MPSTITSPKTYRIKNDIIKLMISESKERKRSEAFIINEALEKKYKKELILIDRKAKDK